MRPGGKPHSSSNKYSTHLLSNRTIHEPFLPKAFAKTCRFCWKTISQSCSCTHETHGSQAEPVESPGQCGRAVTSPLYKFCRGIIPSYQVSVNEGPSHQIVVAKVPCQSNNQLELSHVLLGYVSFS